MYHRIPLIVLFIGLLAGAVACSHTQAIQVLDAPPPGAYRTLGMVSGQGPNLESATHHAVEQADRLEADAIVVQSHRPVGSVIIVTAKAIRYLAPPPEPAP